MDASKIQLFFTADAGLDIFLGWSEIFSKCAIFDLRMLRNASDTHAQKCFRYACSEMLPTIKDASDRLNMRICHSDLVRRELHLLCDL